MSQGFLICGQCGHPIPLDSLRNRATVTCNCGALLDLDTTQEGMGAMQAALLGAGLAGICVTFLILAGILR